MTAGIDVGLLRADETASYLDMLTSHAGNLIYAAPPFLDFLRHVASAEVEVLVARDGGRIIGALPFAILHKPGLGSIVNSLPWWGSHGSIVLDRDAPQATQIRSALLDSFATRMADLSPLASTLILLPEEEAQLALYKDKLMPRVLEPRNGQMTELPLAASDPDAALMALLQQKTRNLVRKGLKQGFEEVITDETWAWDFLAATHSENIEALKGRAKPREHFTALRQHLPPEQRRLAVAMDKGQPVAAMLTLPFNGTVEYVTPAVQVAHRNRQPLSFLIYHGMLAAMKEGHRWWNWGGTWHSQTTLHHFKAGFGAQDRAYTYLISASDDGIATFRARKSELGALFPYFYTYPYGLLDDPA